MTLICLVFIACTVVSRNPAPRISCEPVASECAVLDDDFTLRRMLPESKREETHL